MDSFFDTENSVARNATKRRIVEAALACIKQYGFHKTTVNDITRSSDVTKPTFYRYFKNKEDLVEQIVLNGVMEINAEVDRKIAGLDDPKKKIVESILISARWISRHAEIVAFYNQFNDITRLYNIQNVSPEIRNALFKRWKSLIAAAQAEGVVRRDIKLDDFIHWISFNAMYFAAELIESRKTEKDIRKLINKYIIEGLARPA